MTNEELDRLEALHGEVTRFYASGRTELTRNTEKAIEFAAAAHNALPALIAEIRRLQADLTGEREAVVKALNLCADGENPEILGRPGSPFNGAIKRLGPKSEIERLTAEILRMDKEADVERDVQVACDTTIYETVKRVTGRRCYHTVMEAVEDLARECERLREYEPIAVKMERLKLRGPEGV